MTSEQVRLVQTSFAGLVPTDDDTLKLFFGEIFYSRLFDLHPNLRPLFKGDLLEQGRKLLDMLRMVVVHLEQPEGILPQARELGERHVEYGTREADYASVGAALVWTLEETLGEDFTPELREAWVGAYSLLAGVMQDAARRVPAQQRPLGTG